jgi:hypothetical protein
VFANAGGCGLELVGFGAQLRAQMDALVTATLGSPATISRPPPSRVVAAVAVKRVTPVPGMAPFASGSLPMSSLSSIPVAETETETGTATDTATDADADADADSDNDSDDDSPGSSGSRRFALNVHERMRGLTLVQQLKYAHNGELAERVALERIYGKAVWEALLRNPRLTPPEVARISRMGTLPRPTIEQILGNGAWLAVPEIRRALLTNPRLGVDQVMRIVRLMTKPELKLTTTQTAYPAAVRECARKLLKE